MGYQILSAQPLDFIRPDQVLLEFYHYIYKYNEGGAVLRLLVKMRLMFTLNQHINYSYDLVQF
jgi:hypothetical protein